MAITNYTDLQTTIAGTLNRDDLSSAAQTFISLCEAQVNRDIRHWRMEVRTSGQQSAGDEYMQIPADWVETIRFNVVGNGTSPINLMDSTTMAENRARYNDQYGKPTAYSLEAGQFHLYPTPVADVDLELLYYAQVPDLASNATNWLLSTAPDIYLYGSLLHSAPYLQDDNRVAVWAQLYSAAVTRLNESSVSAKYSGSSLKSKVRGLA
jgi:hypothetical protein